MCQCNIVYIFRRYTFFVQTFKCRQPDFLAIFKFRRISADSVFSIFKCRRVSADKGWLFISSDAKVQTLALSRSWNLVILVQITMPLLLPLTPILTYSKQRGIHCLCFDNLYEGMLDPFLKARFHPLLKTSLTWLYT